MDYQNACLPSREHTKMSGLLVSLKVLSGQQRMLAESRQDGMIVTAMTVSHWEAVVVVVGISENQGKRVYRH